jgi:hypothetical protein
VDGFERRSIILEQPAQRRSKGPRFGDLGARLARTFSTLSPADPGGVPEEHGSVPEEHGSYRVEDHRAAYDDPVLPRYPITRQGYDCEAVDEHVAELEAELTELDREIAELRMHAPARDQVAHEIERIGEQTSAILLAAHDDAQETIRVAQAQANTCISDAAAYAVALTEEANAQLNRVKVERSSISRERALLLEDIRSTAAALTSLADDAAGRLPPESD